MTRPFIALSHPLPLTSAFALRWSGGPGQSRTADQRFRKPLLYPSELRGRKRCSPIFSYWFHAHRKRRLAHPFALFAKGWDPIAVIVPSRTRCQYPSFQNKEHSHETIRIDNSVAVDFFRVGVRLNPQRDSYPIPCSALRPAVKETVRNTGFYAIVLLDNNEMTASFAMGAGKDLRIDSVILNATGDTCVMQVQPLYQVPFSNDGTDFKKRVDGASDRLKAQPAKPETPNK